jgi:hypothetical protein
MTVERPSKVLSNILTTNGYILLKTVKKNVDTLWAHTSVVETLDKSVLDMIHSENYKYRESNGEERIAQGENNIVHTGVTKKT